MKFKFYLLFTLLTFFLTSLTFSVSAQAPLQIPYQGVARDAQGVALQNQDISLILSIEDITGAVLFSETHFTTTNQFGLFNVKIGSVSAMPLNLWSNGDRFLHVKMDPTGGSVFTDLGTTQFLSVPYALYAETSNTPGPQGPAGPQGPQGLQGIQGEVGPQGPAGANGTNGINGQDGVQGPQGPQGIQGPQGDVGPQGPIGLTGPAGATGPQGPIGLTGATGATGPQGPIGLTGATGATGPQGPQGIQGPQGDVGPQGPVGLTGATGATGLQGPAGANGSNGANGQNTLVKTTVEAAGANCATGGVKLEYGLDANSNGTLDAGEINSALTKYVCNGAVGATGATGPQGPIGLTGPAGATGATGPQGPIGLTGAVGATGATGPQGPIGLTGLAGATGATGPQGPIGLTGATGEIGATGPAGPQGIQGATGPQGPIGLTGATGATGPQGPQGEQGIPGLQGPQGEQGPAGANGTNGQSAYEIWLEQGNTGSEEDFLISISQFSPGMNIGDLLFWNGTNWSILGTGNNGEVLTIINNQPQWSGIPIQGCTNINASNYNNAAVVDNNTCEYNYTIGSVGPAGGIIVYDKGFYSEGWRFLEVYSTDFTGSWGCQGNNINGTQTGIGSGSQNTLIIAPSCGGIHAFALTLNEANFSDWFIPSKDELSIIYNNQSLIPGLQYNGSAAYYWSSSEYNSAGAWQIYMANGSWSSGLKNTDYSFRPIRRF